MRSAQIAVSNSAATAIVPEAGASFATTGVAGTPVEVLVKNTDAAIVIYLGGSSVTSADGFPLAAGESVKVSLTGNNLHARAASGTPVAAVLY